MPLVGRDAELSRLEALLDRTAKGSGSGALVEGVGGIGKTKLVQWAAGRARELGFEVYVSDAEQLEQSIPLAAVRRALAPLRGEIEEALEKAVETGSGELLVDVLEARALRRPVLLVIDDLHWADLLTLTLTRAACRRVFGLPFAVVATLRPSGSRPELAHLVDRLSSDGMELMRLGPLEPASVEQVVRSLIGAEPSRSLLTEVEGASGNPFYVVELVAALELEHAIHIHDGHAEVVRTPLPASMRVAILRRVAALPAPTSDLVRTASVLGSSFTAEELAVVTRLSAVDLLRQVAPAIDAGFLDALDDRIGFGHDLVHDAVYDDVPPSIRKAIHRQIARDLAEAGRPASSVAAHMALGADKGDREAVDWLVRAANELGGGTIGAIRVGAETGVHTDLLLRGAELCHDDDPRRFELLARAMLGLTVTFRCAEAEILARRLLDDEALPDEIEPVVRHGFANALTLLGRDGEAREQWRLIQGHRLASAMLRNHAESELAMSAALAGEIAEAERLANETLAHASDHDHPWPPCQALMTLELVAGARGQVREAIERGRESLPLADRDWELGGGLSGARLFAGLALVDADRLEEGKEEIRVDYGRAQRDHLGRSTVERQIGLAAVDYIAGAWDDALVELDSALSFDVDERLELFVGIGILARIHLHRGDVARAQAALERGDEHLATFGPGVGLDLLLWCRALMRSLDGDPAEALSLLTLAWDAITEARFAFGIWRHTWPDLVQIARDAGREDLVRDVVAAAHEGARAADGLGSAHATALWIAGLASKDSEMLAGAADALSATPRVIEAARASEHAGVAQIAGDRGRGVSYLMCALETYQSLDASADIDRVRAHLRGAGVRLGTRGARGRPRFGWEALTASELRIVGLVAEGMTNAQIAERLFISRRTAQNHIANVFTKLGVSNRAELAASAAKRTQ
jgi:DNA-binding CsgD family transcriptional regulator